VLIIVHEHFKDVGEVPVPDSEAEDTIDKKQVSSVVISLCFS
jgi:hypothetical protein